jgi:hypothetical protein
VCKTDAYSWYVPKSVLNNCFSIIKNDTQVSLSTVRLPRHCQDLSFHAVLKYEQYDEMIGEPQLSATEVK